MLYSAITPLLVYSLWSRIDAVQQRSSAGESLGIAVGAVGMGLIVFWCLSGWVEARRAEAREPVVAALLLWATAAAATYLTVMAGLVIRGQSQPFRASGLMLTLLITVLSMTIAAYGTSMFIERREQLKRVEAKRRNLSRLLADAAEFARDQRTALVQVIDEVVSPELKRLRLQAAQLGDETSLTSVRALQLDVGEYATGVVRTLSRDLMSDEPADKGRIPSTVSSRSGARQFVDVLTSARLTVPLIALMALLLTFAQFRRECTMELGVAVGVFIIIELVLLLIGRTEWLRHRFLNFPWLLASAGVGYMAFRASLLQHPEFCEWSSTAIPAKFGIIFATASMFAVAAVIQATTETRETISQIARTNELTADTTRRLQADGVLSRDQISQLLHGPVQGRLAAISLALQIHLSEMQAGLSPSIMLLRERAMILLDEASADLHRIIDRVPPDAEGIFEVIAREAEQWRGLLTITVDVTDTARKAFEGSPRLSVLAGECAEEAITNASRHGRARSVVIRGRLQNDSSGDVVLTIEDDGSGVPADITPGFGLTRFDLLCESWALEPLPTSGTRLTVLLRDRQKLRV